MARNRTIYQTEAIYVSQSPATGAFYPGAVYGVGNASGIQDSMSYIQELRRVQSANYSFSISKTDINQFGELAAIDRIPLEQPVVNADFTYILANFSNEAALGFTISSGTQVSAISGILNKTEDEKNYFIRTVAEGNDVHGKAHATSDAVIGIGNGFLSSYSAQASVGNFPTCTVNVEGLNMRFSTGIATGLQSPAVFPSDGTNVVGWYYSLPTGTQSESGVINLHPLSTSALRPGDISLSLGTAEAGVSFDDMKVQSYNMSFSLSRESLNKLGSKFAFSKEIVFPVSVSLSVTAQVGDTITGDVAAILNNNTTYNPSISINRPGTSIVQTYFQLKGAKLDSQDFSSSIGSNKSVTMNFAAQLGGPQSVTQGLFLSGAN